jgi:hypothetical protein
VNIAVIGWGNAGGGLARRWERAGHTVTNRRGLGPFFYRYARPGEL